MTGQLAKIHAIHRYPVKGLTPEPLPRTALAVHQTVPFDRMYAIENGPSGFDPAAPKPGKGKRTGIGLTNIRERANALGGTCEVESAPNHGTTITVRVPLSPLTRGLIGAEELAAMQPTAFIIDFSRGGIVDQAALTEMLMNKKLAGAALDVFPEEPLPQLNPLWHLPNVILTPHIGGVSPRYMDRAAELFAENLRRYVEGEPLYNRFDVERGY